MVGSKQADQVNRRAMRGGRSSVQYGRRNEDDDSVLKGLGNKQAGGLE